MFRANHESTEIIGENNMACQDKTNKKHPKTNDEALTICKEITRSAALCSATNDTFEKRTENILPESNVKEAASEGCSDNLRFNIADVNLQHEIFAASGKTTLTAEPNICAAIPVNESTDCKAFSTRNPHSGSKVSVINQIYDKSVLQREQETTCSSGNLDASVDLRQKVHCHAENQTQKECENIVNETLPRDVTEIISSRNEDIDITFRSDWNSLQRSVQMVDSYNEIHECHDNGITATNLDTVLFDPTDAGISSLQPSLTTTWGTFFDDKNQRNARNQNRHEPKDHNPTSSTIYDNRTMSNNVQFKGYRESNVDVNLPNEQTNQHESIVHNSEPTHSRDDISNPNGVTNTSDGANSRELLDDVTVVSTATSEESQSTANTKQNLEVQSEDSMDMETIISDVEAAQFDFGSVIPRCHGTVISPKERTEEDAQALLKQIISGETDPCLAPEVVAAYVKSEVEIVNVVDEKQNVSLHNATTESLNDGFCNLGTQNNQKTNDIPNTFYQHALAECDPFSNEIHDPCFEGEKNENGRFPYCTPVDVSIVDSVILTPRNSTTFCIDDQSKIFDGKDRDPKITRSHTHVNESNAGSTWYQDKEDLNGMSESQLADYEQSHVIYQPIRTGSFVVSRNGRRENRSPSGDMYGMDFLNKNHGQLNSPTCLQRQMNGYCLPYISPEVKPSQDSLGLTKSPHSSPLRALIGSICPSNSEVDSVGGYKATCHQISHANRMNGIRSLLGPTSCLYKAQGIEDVKSDKSNLSYSRKQTNTIPSSHKPSNDTAFSRNGGLTSRRRPNEPLRNNVKEFPENGRLLPDINQYQATRNDNSFQNARSPQRVRKTGLTVSRGSSLGQDTNALQHRDKGEPCPKRNSSSHDALTRHKAHVKSNAGVRGTVKTTGLVSSGSIKNNKHCTDSSKPGKSSNSAVVQSTTSKSKEIKHVISISTGSECSSSCTISSCVHDTGTQNTNPTARHRPVRSKRPDTQSKHSSQIDSGWATFDKGNGPYYGSYVPSCLLYTPKKHLNPKTTSAEEYHKYKMDLRLSQSLARIKRGPPTVDCYLDPKFKPKQERTRSRSQKRHQRQSMISQSGHVMSTDTAGACACMINRNKNSSNQLTVI